MPLSFELDHELDLGLLTFGHSSFVFRFSLANVNLMCHALKVKSKTVFNGHLRTERFLLVKCQQPCSTRRFVVFVLQTSLIAPMPSFPFPTIYLVVIDKSWLSLIVRLEFFRSRTVFNELQNFFVNRKEIQKELVLKT